MKLMISLLTTSAKKFCVNLFIHCTEYQFSQRQGRLMIAEILFVVVVVVVFV